jgi:transposase
MVTFTIFLMADGRALDHKTLEGYRFAAVTLHKRDVPVVTIAESFGVTTEAVYIWLKRARTEGVRSLRSSKAPGPVPALDRTNFSELLRAIRRPASKLGYPTDLWSGPRLRHFIKREFNIEYHRKHMPRLLRRLGLNFKFPERRALEQDPKEVRDWKKRRLPQIVKFAKAKKALVFYADESLVSLIPYVGRTWSFPQAKPIVRVSGRRGQHVGITAAVNAQGRMGFELTREKEMFTAKVFLRFVRKLRREQLRRFIVLIVDGAPTHTAKIVKAYAKENKKSFRLEILPAYSPELNPSEKPWGFLKSKNLNGSQAGDKSELRSEVKGHMKKLKNNKSKVSSFF